MAKLALVVSLCCLLLFGHASSSLTIPIQNSSFETTGPLYQDTCGQRSNQVPGWNQVIGTSILLPDPTLCEISAAPDGKAVALVGNATLSQDLGTPATQPAGVYRLTFYVANYNYYYAGIYTASLYIGDLQLCSASGHAIGDFIQIPLVCPLRDRVPANLRFSFSATQEPLMLDAISPLTFTPN